VDRRQAERCLSLQSHPAHLTNGTSLRRHSSIASSAPPPVPSSTSWYPVDCVVIFLESSNDELKTGMGWSQKMSSQVTTIDANAKQVFTNILKGEKPPETEKFLEFFGELEPISVDSMIGLWRVVALGRSPGDRTAAQPDPGPLPQRKGLGMNSLYGKRFVTRDDAEPVVCFDEGGSLVLSADFGLARLREASFRGISSAAMVYDQHPWMDYFRKLDEDTLVAVIDIKGNPINRGFFLLRD
jgi:Domain of unknown function (DUF4334)